MAEYFDCGSCDDIYGLPLELNADFALDSSNPLLKSGRGGLLG
jgi:hypothetical protein